MMPMAWCAAGMNHLRMLLPTLRWPVVAGLAAAPGDRCFFRGRLLG